MTEHQVKCDNLALEGSYVSPATWRPLRWDQGRGVFSTGDGGERFSCIAGEIPDFRLDVEPLDVDEVERVRAHLKTLWREAEGTAGPTQDLEAVPPSEERRYCWRTLRVELWEFVKFCLRGRPWTQADSMNLYRRVTDVYPNALRAPVQMLKDGRLHTASLMRFKELSLEPLARLIGQHQVRSVLDLGCGWGGNTILLQQMFPNLEVWAFDYSPYRILSAQFNLRQLGLTPYRLFVADGSRIPLLDDSVDLIFTSHVLEQMKEVLTPVLREIHRVARRFAVHIEPTFRYADWAHRFRVLRKGYPRDLLQRSLLLGWRLQEYRPANPTWAPTPAEWIVLEKDVAR